MIVKAEKKKIKGQNLELYSSSGLVDLFTPAFTLR